MNETEQLTKVRDGLIQWRDLFKDLNNGERERAIEQFIEWFDNQKFTHNE